MMSKLEANHIFSLLKPEILYTMNEIFIKSTLKYESKIYPHGAKSHVLNDSRLSMPLFCSLSLAKVCNKFLIILFTSAGHDQLFLLYTMLILYFLAVFRFY